MAVAPITPAAIRTGPGRLRWAPLGTTIPTFTVTASKFSPTWTNWNDAGPTEAGITYTESVETADIRVAESLYPIRTVTTSKSSRISGTLSEPTDVNWKLVANGGTATVTGSTTTKMVEYAPALAGAEIRVMLSFQSNLDDEILVWPQVFQVGSLEVVYGTYETASGLSFEFNAELPATGYTTPYKRFTSGVLALS